MTASRPEGAKLLEKARGLVDAWVDKPDAVHEELARAIATLVRDYAREQGEAATSPLDPARDTSSGLGRSTVEVDAPVMVDGEETAGVAPGLVAALRAQLQTLRGEKQALWVETDCQLHELIDQRDTLTQEKAALEAQLAASQARERALREPGFYGRAAARLQVRVKALEAALSGLEAHEGCFDHCYESGDGHTSACLTARAALESRS